MEYKPLLLEEWGDCPQNLFPGLVSAYAKECTMADSQREVYFQTPRKLLDESEVLENLTHQAA